MALGNKLGFLFLFTFLLSVLYLSMQREEELAKERARAEQLKQEREILAQKEEADRQARKKVTNLSVIMIYTHNLYR